MSQELLSSKVVILEEQPRVRSIQGVQTSLAAFVGVTERGPLATPTLITSFDEYRAVFGGYTANSDVATAVSGFFEEGGNFCYVIRTVHYVDPSSPGTKTSLPGATTLQTPSGGATRGVVTGTTVEPFNLVGFNEIELSLDGGAPVSTAFNGFPATRETDATEVFALTNGDVLELSIDMGPLQSVVFLTGEFANIGAATALEVVTVINANILEGSAEVTSGKVTIKTDSFGTTPAFLDIIGGTANVALDFPTGGSNGSGRNVAALTVVDIKEVIEANIPGATVNDINGSVQIVSNATTGPASTIEVLAISTADTGLGLDNAVHAGGTGSPVDTLQVDGKSDGTYANSLSIEVLVATSGVATEFNMNVLEDGVIIENYPNLSMVDTEARYAETIVNASSNLVDVTDLDVGTTDQRPSNSVSPMVGGDDGLVGLVDGDFIGDSTGATGIRALDTVQDVNLLSVPNQATAAIYVSMINYCETVRDGSIFAILDTPAAQTAQTVVSFVDTAGIKGLSEYGAIYWPHVEIINPAPAVFGDSANITVAPSGNIAGVYARNDGARPGGIYVPPAGIENGQLRGVVGFETDEVLDEAKRDFVAPNRINILTTFPGAPQFIDGSDVLKGNGNFPFVSQRRGAIFIEQSVKRGIEFARHQNNSAKLRREVERTIRGFLLVQMNNGAFASTDPSKAFFVIFNEALNPPSAVAAGKLNGRVGLAFNTPAVFIIVRFSKDTRALEAELQS